VLGVRVEDIESETPPVRLVNTVEVEIDDVAKPEIMPLALREVDISFVLDEWLDELLEEYIDESDVERDVKSDIGDEIGVETGVEGDPLARPFDKVSDVEYVEAPGVRLLEVVTTDVTVAKEEAMELAMLEPLVGAL
jgi:hypothetical protein